MLEFSYVLSRYPVACQGPKIESLGAAGGLSGARFWRITGPQGLYALRRWPSEHPAPEQLQFIHGVLSHAARRGIACLPMPIATTDGRTFVQHDGHLWELAPWLPGAANYDESPNPVKLAGAMTALANFHVATADYESRFGSMTESPANAIFSQDRPCPAIAHRLERLRKLQKSGIGSLERAISAADWPELARSAKAFVELLPSAVPLVVGLLAPLAELPSALQPCIRDVWHDHVLFVGDEVAGLIDFGALAIDAPVVDVTRLLGSLAKDDATDWQRGLEAYTTVRPLAAAERRAVAALDASGTVLAGCNWIRWVFVEDRQFDNRPQVEQRFEMLLDRLERLVRRNGPITL